MNEQPYYQPQPVQPQPPYPPQRRSSPESVAALVCGILSILFSFSVVIGIALGVVAFVLARSHARQNPGAGSVTAAKVCGIVGSALSVCFLCLYVFLGCVAYDLIRTAVDDGSFSEGGVSVSVDEDEGRASLSIEGENGLDVDFGVEGPSFG